MGMGRVVMVGMIMAVAVAMAIRRRCGAIGIGADTLHMMVVAFLRQPDLRLETQNLRPVFAQAAVHLVFPYQNLLHPISEGVEHEGVIFQILGVEKFDRRMAR